MNKITLLIIQPSAAYVVFFILLRAIPTISDGMMYQTQNFTTLLREDLMRTPDVIEANGYMAETHEVTTEDGYILSLHRIPYGKGLHRNTQKKRKVVLLCHGLHGSSVGWLLPGAKSLPLMLADEGYDVWLWNARGTIYSRRHVNLTTDDPKYWNFSWGKVPNFLPSQILQHASLVIGNFVGSMITTTYVQFYQKVNIIEEGKFVGQITSFHEQGYYDVASSIDYALQQTGQTSLYLIGHSKGSTVSYVLLSTRPEYNLKVRLLVCYAPAIYNKHATSPVLRAMYDNITTRRAKLIMNAGKLHSVPAMNDANFLMKRLSAMLCGKNSRTLNYCIKLLFVISGYDFELLNMKMVPSIFIHFPAGGSMKEMIHFLQVARTDRFAMYDLGKRKNLLTYGTPLPPRYPIENVWAPVSFYYGDNDLIITKVDVDRLIRETRNVAGVFRVPHQKFNHLDFQWGRTADVILFKPTMKLMSKY